MNDPLETAEREAADKRDCLYTDFDRLAEQEDRNDSTVCRFAKASSEPLRCGWVSYQQNQERA